MWTLNAAVDFIRFLEPVLAKAGFHCGLTGGSIFKGTSDKDVDVIVYPHQSGMPNQPDREAAWDAIHKLLKPDKSCKCEGVSQIRDHKDVRWVQWQGKRADFLFLS